MASGARCLFSDIDGTLVHYPDVLDALGTLSAGPGGGVLSFDPAGSRGPAVPCRALPPSGTGLVGYVSVETLALCQRLRAAGHRLVLISGARASTFLGRLPWLPRADAYVLENGGRVFFDDPSGPCAAPVREDHEWRSVHDSAAGPAGQEHVPPERRAGALWAFYRQMRSAGWACDAASYTTGFRVKLRASSGKTEADLREAIRGAPGEVACSFNLGAADFYPATSGKENAARHVASALGVALSDCVAMCDDDNDLGLAAALAHAYVPGCTSESMRAAVRAGGERFTEAEVGGLEGTEALLRRIGDEFGVPADG